LNDLKNQDHLKSQGQTDLTAVISPLTNVRVLYVLDDIPARLFPFWASRSIDQKDDIARDIDESLFSDDSIERTVNIFIFIFQVADICIAISNLGIKLSGLQKVFLKLVTLAGIENCFR
jgi:hypothetical protein